MADSKLFEKDQETPEGTISDPTMVVAYGKIATPTLNITWNGIVTWLIAQLGATFAKRSENLNDLSNKSTARANLGAAGKYLIAQAFTYSGGAQGVPQPITIDPTTVDIINLTSTGNGWYRLPMPSDYSIPTGTRIVIRNPGSSDKALRYIETEINSGNCHIHQWGVVELYFNGALWGFMNWNTNVGFS